MELLAGCNLILRLTKTDVGQALLQTLELLQQLVKALQPNHLLLIPRLLLLLLLLWLNALLQVLWRRQLLGRLADPMLRLLLLLCGLAGLNSRSSLCATLMKGSCRVH